jgi:hypothetical protein
MDRGPPLHCKLCGEVGHQAIGCHYHLSILDDKGVLDLKNKTSDFGKDMNMSYIIDGEEKMEDSKGAHFERSNEGT